MRELTHRGLLLRAATQPARHSDRGLTGLTIAPDGTLTILDAGFGLGVRLGGLDLVSLALLLGQAGVKLMCDSDAAAQAASDALDRIIGEAAGHA